MNMASRSGFVPSSSTTPVRHNIQRDVLTQFSLARTMDDANQGEDVEDRGRTRMGMMEIVEARLRRTATSYCNMDSLAKGQ